MTQEPPIDPEMPYQLRLAITVSGYGKRRHQLQAIAAIKRALQVAGIPARIEEL